MLILRSGLLNKHKEIIFGFSTKIGAGRNEPYYFNLSSSVGDNENSIKENRELFYSSLGLKRENIALQKQVHGNEVKYVQSGGFYGESDALITNKRQIGLAISTADCTPVFIFDDKNKVIAAIHSGWRGTEKKILPITLEKLKDDFNSNPEDLIVYIGPSICQMHYEVGSEVAEKFEEAFIKPKEDKYLLDVAGVNYRYLTDFSIPKKNIQLSNLCTYELSDLLHSYRRDGSTSGRAYGIIAMK